jgi:hypothetical protein
MCSEFPYILFERIFKSFNATIADFFNIQVEGEQGESMTRQAKNSTAQQVVSWNSGMDWLSGGVQVAKILH